jgi:hypothetical protein
LKFWNFANPNSENYLEVRKLVMKSQKCGEMENHSRKDRRKKISEKKMKNFGENCYGPFFFREGLVIGLIKDDVLP